MESSTIYASLPAHAELPVFDGKKLKDMNPHALARWGIEAGVPGMSSENGLQANVMAYAAHLEKIGKAAADAAIADWLSNHPRRD